jgi:uncharacterized RDD family membrane protein YckC
MYTIIGGDGKEYGPVTAAQIRAWMASGRASLDTQAKFLGTDEWKRLGDFPEFTGGVAPPLLDSPSPSAQADLASRVERLGSWLLDTLFAMICFSPLLIGVPLAVLSAALKDHDWQSVATLPGMVFSFCFAAFALLALAIVQIWMLSTRGQTIGKRIVGIRIVRAADGSPPGFVHAWLLRDFVRGILCSIPVLGRIFCLVDLCFIFRADRRCIHDLIAGTRVISARRPEASQVGP